MRQRMRTAMSLLIISAACVVGVEIFYFFTGKYFSFPVTESKVSAQTALKKAGNAQSNKHAGQDAQENARIILERKIFGDVLQEGSSVSESIAVDELQITSLDLVLTGTAIGVNLENIAIILNKKDKKQDIYHVGDSIAGAVIKQILRGKIILNVGGTDEILDMQESIKNAGKGPAAVSSTERDMQMILPPVRTPLVVEQMEISELERDLVHDTDAASVESQSTDTITDDGFEDGTRAVDTDEGAPAETSQVDEALSTQPETVRPK